MLARCKLYVCLVVHAFFFVFFFNDTATTEIYTLSLHDALPISVARDRRVVLRRAPEPVLGSEEPRQAHAARVAEQRHRRSEEHTSELQSPCNLVCRLLLEKKTKPLDRTDDCSYPPLRDRIQAFV